MIRKDFASWLTESDTVTKHAYSAVCDSSIQHFYLKKWNKKKINRSGTMNSFPSKVIQVLHMEEGVVHVNHQQDRPESLLVEITTN